MIGKQVLHYRILEELGRGGMGVVYKAEDTRLDRTVAIKFLPRHVSANREERERFVIEAKAAAALNHPNIATIHAIEEADDEMFIVMEYIEGQELQEIIKSGVPDLQSAMDYAAQIAEGLQAAHEKGIVHRDIKSANIMITNSGRVKIMDFGLAKLQGTSGVTRIGSTLGTVAYMSPEQARGDEADERSDIWSFGIVMYEMLTGRQPFEGAYEQAVMYAIMHEAPRPFGDTQAEIPAWLEPVVMKCLEKQPDNRYQKVSEITAALRGSTAEPDTVRSGRGVPAESNTPKIRQRYKILGSIVLLIILLVVLMPPGRRFVSNWLQPTDFPREQHLTILPFTNIGGDPARQAFCDGLVETLTSKLSQLEQFKGTLWVIPSSEVRRNKVGSPAEAHKIFEANLAVNGNLQFFNDIYRLTLNLVDAENLRQINSTVIDVSPDKLYTLQEKSVTALLEMLNFEIKPGTEDVLKAGVSTVPGANEFYLQGRGYLLRYEDPENIDTALELFARAIQQDSLFALAYAGMGEAYWRKYEAHKNTRWVEKAENYCNKAMALDNNLAPVKVTMGMVCAGTGQYEKAEAYFKNAITLEPTSAEAYRGLAQAYEAQNKLDAAEATYRKAIQLQPDYWGGYNELGNFYYTQGRYENAVEQFRQVTALAPDNYRGYNNLGAVYYLLHRWENASEMFERSFALRKSYSVASNLGTLYYIQGKYSDAARMYEKALQLNDHDYRVWGNLAAAYYWSEGERKKSGPAFRNAIQRAEAQKKINRNDPDLLSQLAGYYAMTGQREQSLHYLHKALDIAPMNQEVMFRAGTAYEQLGNREKALLWIKKALDNGYSRSQVENQPELKQLLADPQFKKILAAGNKTAGKKTSR